MIQIRTLIPTLAQCLLQEIIRYIKLNL